MLPCRLLSYADADVEAGHAVDQDEHDQEHEHEHQQHDGATAAATQQHDDATADHANPSADCAGSSGKQQSPYWEIVSFAVPVRSKAVTPLGTCC
eukprot:jgi/Chrzof1/6144/Cz17g13030.t1